MSTAVEIELREWKLANPESHPQLAGLSFDGHPEARRAARRLCELQRLEIVERRDGLAIETNSFVGALTIGPIRITIQPKLRGDTLLKLLRYAYGLRNLELQAQHRSGIADASFQDLLLHQLAAEVRELIDRGLHRTYQVQQDWLAMPRGRIDFGRMVSSAGLATASLPCRYHDRDVDCFPNRVLLAGLRLGSTLATDAALATRLRQLVRRLDDGITPLKLDAYVFARLQREQNRLLAAYAAAFSLIRILAQDGGASTKDEEQLELPGFLFDMNRFFEKLIERFLREHLPAQEYQIQSQSVLRRLFVYDGAHNPRGRQSPRPRPDFIITGPGQRTTVLDAKYRDLWEQTLPREMLYQLAVYAQSGAGNGQAAILFPTTAANAEEQRVLIRNPLTGSTTATVVLRPVRVAQLASLLMSTASPAVIDCRAELARQLAFG